MKNKTRLLVIAGPTATGKSELAVQVARLLDGEIISADSVQLYRHFNIGSAKPGRQFMEAAVHHLINVRNPDEPFTMWDFRQRAQKAIEEITSRGKISILAGGSGLYLKALLENLDGGAPSNPQMRADLIEKFRKEGTAGLYEKLKTLDSQKAQKTDPNDRYRIIRGIENTLLPKKPASPSTNPQYKKTFFVLCGERKLLYERIDRRVEKMFADGWIDEAKAILEMGYDKNCKPFKSLGYRSIIKYLSGELDEKELVQLVQKETRNYAKRQITWFAKVKGAIWLNSIAEQKSLPGILANHFRSGQQPSHAATLEVANNRRTRPL